MNAALTQGAYTGPRVAGLNPYSTQAADGAAGYANGNGANTANTFYQNGMALAGQGTNYANNAQSVFGQTQTDPSQQFLSTANSYANSPYADSMIDAANRDVSRDLNETQLPTLALNAAGSGNTNSTRTGITQGILQRGASDRMADTAANIRGQLFNTGLGMAQTQYNTNTSNALQANGQLGTAAQLGNSELLNGQQANGNNFDQLNAAGQVFQTQDQAQLTGQQQQWQDQLNTPLNILGQYQNVIGGKWGGQPVSSVGPSTVAAGAQGALGGAALGASIGQKLGSYVNQNPNAAYQSGGYNPSTDSSYYSGFDNPDNYG
jgi:hypothetical protein